MNKKPGTSKDAADKLFKNIRRKTRQTYCPSSYKMGHQSGLNIGGSGSVA